MKKLLYIICLSVLFGFTFAACGDDDDEQTWEKYKVWHDNNQTWYNAQIGEVDETTGDLFYEQVIPIWAKGQCIYMHWFNDRSETALNYVPDLTSTISAYYEGYLYDGTLFDSSKNLTDETFTTQLSKVISGWKIALQNMHVGDTVQMIIPYQLAYGESGSGSIPPYSVLRFNMRLVDVPDYEVRP